VAAPRPASRTAAVPELIVGLGANLGDARAALRGAVAALHALPGVQSRACSALWRSAPVDAPGEDYLNAVVSVSCPFSAQQALQQLQNIEQQAGRQRPYRHAPRTLDLDLLFWGDEVIDTPTLTVPHPRWRERAFVLYPLAEVAPQRVTPAMLAAVSAQRIQRLTEPFP